MENDGCLESAPGVVVELDIMIAFKRFLDIHMYMQWMEVINHVTGRGNECNGIMFVVDIVG